MNSSGSGLIVVGVSLIIGPISFLIMHLFQLFILSWFNFGVSHAYRNLSFSFKAFQFNGIQNFKGSFHDSILFFCISYSVSIFTYNCIKLSLLAPSVYLAKDLSILLMFSKNQPFI